MQLSLAIARICSATAARSDLMTIGHDSASTGNATHSTTGFDSATDAHNLPTKHESHDDHDGGHGNPHSDPQHHGNGPDDTHNDHADKHDRDQDQDQH